MKLGDATIPIVVALIAAAAGFIGAYLGSRWQAEGTRAQWQRDRLLQFCADFLGVARRLIDIAREQSEG